MANKTLDIELKDLQKNAIEGDKLFENSKTVLYRNLAHTYMFWRKANMQIGYLEDCYKNKNIKFKNVGNKPNFNALIKLVFNIPTSKRNLIGNWANSLNAIDDEYITNSHLYKNEDGIEDLVHWIQDNGGLGGITTKGKERIEEDGYDGDYVYKEPKKTKKPASLSENKKKHQQKILELKKLASSKQKSKTKIDVGSIGTDEDDFVILLAKKTSNNNSELKVVGTTAKSEIVNSAIMEIGELEYANTPYSLKLLCDSLRINIIPKALQDYGARLKFHQSQKIKDDDGKFIKNEDGTDFKINETTRLICKTDGAILVSKSTTKVSLVTIVTPTTKFKLKEDIWLRGSDRYYVETNLIHDAEIALYNAEPQNNLADVKNTKLKATKQLSLKNTETKKTRNLYFYDFSRVNENTLYQPTIKNEQIKWNWEVIADASFIERFNSQHFDSWVHRVKKNIHIKANKSVCFVVTKDGIICEKKWIDGEYTQVGNRYLTSFGDDGELSNGKQTNKFTFAPTDILQTLDFISKTNIKGKVTIKANEHLMLVTFKNDVAKFDVYIPSTIDSGKRNETYFKKFIANE